MRSAASVAAGEAAGRVAVFLNRRWSRSRNDGPASGTPVDRRGALGVSGIWREGAGAEMLYLPAYAWGPSNGAAVTHLLFLLAVAVLLAEAVGLWPALAVLTAPVFAKTAPSAYVDVVLAAAVVVCVWLAMRDQWALAGLLAGFAFSVKYSAFPAPLWLVGYARFRGIASRRC